MNRPLLRKAEPYSFFKVAIQIPAVHPWREELVTALWTLGSPELAVDKALTEFGDLSVLPIVQLVIVQVDLELLFLGVIVVPHETDSSLFYVASELVWLVDIPLDSQGNLMHSMFWHDYGLLKMKFEILVPVPAWLLTRPVFASFT